MDGIEESEQFLTIQLSVCAHARAEIEAKWSDCVHRLSDIARIQTTRKKNRDTYLLADPTAKAPVVTAARASQLFHRERGIARVQKNRVDRWRNSEGFVDGAWPGHMDDLHDFDARQGPSKIGMRS